jgi:hypothetical protein
MRLTRRQRIYFWLRHKMLHRMKHSPYRPKRVIERRREHKLTLTRGYSTFVLDEFDFHFNKMAADSLRFHLSPRCIVDNEPRRKLYDALIARLEEPLWIPYLHNAFKPRTARPAVDKPVSRLHRLRNRIAHHEPLLHRDKAAGLLSVTTQHLVDRRADLLTVAELISPDLQNYIADTSGVHDQLNAIPELHNATRK